MVTARLGRLRLGHLGDAKTIRGAKGLYELRIHHGPGYRMYFGKHKGKLIILLCGGTKSDQKKDIDRAKRYWNDCLLTRKEKK